MLDPLFMPELAPDRRNRWYRIRWPGERQLQLLGLATGPAFASPGQTYSQTSTGTGPTPGLGQIIGNAGGDFAGWLQMQQLLKQQGGG